MENELIFSAIIMIIFSIFKYIELKLESDVFILKHFVRDAIEVGGASFLGLYIASYIKPIVTTLLNNVTDSKVMDYSKPPVFTGEPGF
jgi:hypothetical protein